MGKKASDHEASRDAQEALSIDTLREQIESLPEGTKENAAYESLAIVYERDGEGCVSKVHERVTRLEFRKLWLEIRCPKKTAPKPSEGVKK